MSLLLPYNISQPHCYLSCFQGDPWWNAEQHVSSPESAEGSESEETDDEETEDDEEKNEEEEVEGTTSKSFTNHLVTSQIPESIINSFLTRIYLLPFS